MANINAPFGARPVGYRSGATYQGKANLYYLPATNGDAIHIGDFVIGRAAADANGVPGCDKAAASNTVRGIVVGVLGAYPGATMAGAALNLEQAGYVSATNTDAVYVLVADEPDLVFEIQCGSVTTNLTAAKAEYNFDITVAVPSPATNPLSATIVDNSSIATTNTLPFKMLGPVRSPENTPFAAYQVVLATFNLHELSGAGTTAI